MLIVLQTRQKSGTWVKLRPFLYKKNFKDKILRVCSLIVKIGFEWISISMYKYPKQHNIYSLHLFICPDIFLIKICFSDKNNLFPLLLFFRQLEVGPKYIASFAQRMTTASPKLFSPWFLGLNIYNAKLPTTLQN